ncbi:hypothetical protein BHE74_00056187 [Ensete ventricosum]|nr:hypothetical protein BHE74_00056187 [Ensete ventricosum]
MPYVLLFPLSTVVVAPTQATGVAPLRAGRERLVPCGLAAGRRPLRAGCWPSPLAVAALQSAAPAGAALQGSVPVVDPDREDEASSSLAVSTRWISAAKLLQYDLVTFAQREGGE